MIFSRQAQLLKENLRFLYNNSLHLKLQLDALRQPLSSLLFVLREKAFCLPGRFFHGFQQITDEHKCQNYSETTVRAISSFMISLLPPQIGCTLASTQVLHTGYSHMQPQPPCSCTHSQATRFSSSDILDDKRQGR